MHIHRPALRLQTVYFHDSDRADAVRLGDELYGQLTRPPREPLAHGAGIPVFSGVTPEAVQLDAAEIVVVIVVVGNTAHLIAEQREAALRRMTEWHRALGRGHVVIVPTAAKWAEESRLPSKPVLTELYGAVERRRQRTIDEIVLAVTRLLEDDPVLLYVSHAKADVEATDDAARQIHHQVVADSTAKGFFLAAELLPAESLPDEQNENVGRGVFVAVHGDVYSSRAWCQRELYRAKLHGLPTLTVEVLRRGEHRTSPYGGNGPSMVWDGNPAAVVSRAMVEWLRAAFFRREAQRIVKIAGLPGDVTVVARPPELLDLAQGPLQSVYAQLVMHPDPELSVIERQILKASRPRLQLVTPTTAFRRLLNRDGGSAALTSPLQGFQVAMSLASSPDVNGAEGYTTEHVRDATVYLVRSLISAGAAIAYGGDFRKMEHEGFTPLLAELVQAYNQTASSSAEFLHSYLAAPVKLDDAPGELPLTVHHLIYSEDVRGDALLPPPAAERHPDALYYSDMRRVMAKHTSARAALGGNALPRLKDGDRGHGGRYPGVVEEAWRTLQVGKPLYVIGGFGGASALVADLFQSDAIPERLRDQTWMHSDYFREKAEAIDNDPYRLKLELPQRMEDLAEAIITQRKRFLATDATSVKWNGLTLDENQVLFRNRDPIIIASLVLKGLLNMARQQRQGKLEVELVLGSVTTASHLDAISVAVFDAVPLGGAGEALDRAIGGRASAARAEGRTLISLAASAIDADWLFLASLGPLRTVEGLEERIESAARATSDQALRHGFTRVGVVAFGGAVLTNLSAIAEAMLRGFGPLKGVSTIVWFESDPNRFETLRTTLEAHEDVRVTTRRSVTSVPATRQEDLLFVQVNLENDELSVTALPPQGTAIASSRRIPLAETKVTELSDGPNRTTPDLKVLENRGREIAELLFEADAAQILARCQKAKLVIIHDLLASKIPFEMLGMAAPAERPAVLAGLTRRLAVRGVPIDRLFARPAKIGKLNVLLIVNPTGDLEGTEDEAKQVRAILAQQSQLVDLKELCGEEATKSAVLQALALADILHYCGHAFFDGPGPDESGLVLHGDEALTLKDFENCQSLPRVAFVNACEAGRVRGTFTTEAAAFAELFLRSGIEAYLGTYWRVGDAAAAQFASDVYARLATGRTLDTAVTEARAELLKSQEPDWANYLLYGDGRFKLVAD